MASQSEISTFDTVEHFFGVYLLYSLHEKYKGRTYIGFTVDPNRRITQHNKGSQSGGARRTNNRGPWEMVLIVHGFPNDISALRFEWAWQHPKRSRRLRELHRKKPRENQFQYCLRILLEMLRMGPWSKLPLTVRWLAEEFYQEFPVDKCPPMHMPITIGPVRSKKVITSTTEVPTSSTKTCLICNETIPIEDLVQCVTPGCSLHSHLLCLASLFIGNNSQNLLPVEGYCPQCNTYVLWGDIIRKRIGCIIDSK
ncbi:structure-specific endonuclease subunit slx1 [Macrosteles quadrilineatus]|uniref:structure-specific endonuclease subunit slx1 n=1 Tax=Macrosteles quadrilineatus TaxID=74068 RepID=UPI0023E281C4|nr:structure-specific endonuclease subunit slx1 [Macrosteles quadrilineatus]XP_054280326.1 structure-specific endonuclease subunit slx1 [Macrosteles quadrilineatus]XP_054280327.1 structure-specific endonuclease subunit slx1 [Macrosteles quadrilineatus]